MPASNSEVRIKSLEMHNALGDLACVKTTWNDHIILWDNS